MTTDRTKSGRPAWLIPALAISALLMVILFSLGIVGGAKKTEPGNKAAPGQALPSGAQTYIVSNQAAQNSSAWQGTVRSRLAVKLAPKINARIMEITVHPGDRVKKGEVIARLDDRELRANTNAAQSALAAAQAQAAQAQAEQKRIVELYDKQAATRQNYDAVVAQAKAAQALANQAASNVQQSKVVWEENILTAPFSGVVGERWQEPGEMGAPNQAIVTLLKPDDLRLEVAVADHCAAGIKIGKEVQVRIDALQQVLHGSVDEILPEVDQQTRSQMLKVKLPETPGLQPGQFAWLELACEAKQTALMIPATAVVHYGQLETVKVVEQGMVYNRHIRTGKSYGAELEVLSGLKAGETILVQGGVAL